MSSRREWTERTSATRSVTERRMRSSIWPLDWRCRSCSACRIESSMRARARARLGEERGDLVVRFGRCDRWLVGGLGHG